MKRTWYDTLKYWNGKEILRECKYKNRLCVHANVWNTCTDKPCEKESKLLGKEADQFIVDEANAYTKGEKMTNKYMKGHLIDYTCVRCKHHKTSAEEVPCSYCSNNYQSQYEEAPQIKEFTEEELIQAFRDKFIERRAISLDEVREVVKELFK